MRGRCQHGTERWLYIPCKRRGCPVCGEHRRHMVAWRISAGVEHYQGAGWFVGTFARDVTKAEAVKVQGKFVRWLRSHLGYQVEYAATWELHRSGRLHLNLILAPWRFVPQSLLSQKWERFGGGPVAWIALVGAGIGAEAAKSRERVSNYFAKFEQMVQDGRGIAYSRGWPKLPELPTTERKGRVSWVWLDSSEPYVRIFDMERDKGHWHEVGPGEWASAYGEPCDCFLTKSSHVIN